MKVHDFIFKVLATWNSAMKIKKTKWLMEIEFKFFDLQWTFSYDECNLQKTIIKKNREILPSVFSQQTVSSEDSPQIIELRASCSAFFWSLFEFNLISMSSCLVEGHSVAGIHSWFFEHDPKEKILWFENFCKIETKLKCFWDCHLIDYAIS